MSSDSFLEPAAEMQPARADAIAPPKFRHDLNREHLEPCSKEDESAVEMLETEAVAGWGQYSGPDALDPSNDS
eukprot:SAG31_NODE_20078_length_584_cov_1.068041_1_plen_72_part_10